MAANVFRKNLEDEVGGVQVNDLLGKPFLLSKSNVCHLLPLGNRC